MEEEAGRDPGTLAKQLQEQGIWRFGDKGPKWMMFQGEILIPSKEESSKQTDKQSLSNELFCVVSAPSPEEIKSSWGVLVTHL